MCTSGGLTSGKRVGSDAGGGNGFINGGGGGGCSSSTCGGGGGATCGGGTCGGGGSVRENMVACESKKHFKYELIVIPRDKPKTKKRKWKTWLNCKWELITLAIDDDRCCSFPISFTLLEKRVVSEWRG